MDIILAIVITAVLFVSVLPGAMEGFNDSLFNQIYYSATLGFIGIFYIMFTVKMVKKLKKKREVDVD